MERKTTTKLFRFRPAIIKEFFEAVKSLKINKPLGPCSIPAWTPEDRVTEIVLHLTMMMN